VLGALFVARFLWPEFSHASPSRLQTESADRYFELSPAPLCAEGVYVTRRTRTRLVRRWQGAPVTTGEDQDQAVPARRARPSRRRCRRGGARLPPPSASSRVSRIPSSWVPRPARYASRVTQRPSYHVVRGDGLYSSQRRINYNINEDVRRNFPTYTAATRARHARARSERA